MIRESCGNVWLLAFALGSPAGANAQDSADACATSGWSVEVTPHVWAAGLDGNTAANGTGSEIDADYEFFSLDNLDFALGTSLEARRAAGECSTT